MEVFINIIEYVAIIMSAIILVYKTNFVLKYYQQSHYRLSSFKKTIKYYYFGKWQYFIWGTLLFIMFLNFWYVQLIYVVYIIFLLIIFNKKKDIIKLRQTVRIYRNYFVLLLLGTIFSSTLLLLFDLPELVASLAIILFLLPVLILISSVIVLPVEKLISKYYQTKAKKKLKRINPIVIGITGSFGKTSTKNILYEFLKEKYITLATPKSYNTLNGVSLTINEELSNIAEVFIVEMGASHVGDIGDLVALAKPKIAILTGITKQHLETFKTVPNIINEKAKILESLSEDGLGFINGDDKLILSYNLKTKAKIITFGLNNNNDYYATDIVMDANKMKFTINFKKTSINVETKLVGKHNVCNILAAFSVANELKVGQADIKYQISLLEATKHRLSVDVVGSYTIIDDAFNSNIIGFNNALEVLDYYPEPRVLITPGIVEAGSYEEEINYGLAIKIKDVADEVVLIQTKASDYIKKGLVDLEFKNIVVVDSFKEAKKYVFDKFQKASILIENDVSDIYKI